MKGRNGSGVDGEAGVNGLGRPPVAEPDYRDVDVPDTKEKLQTVISRGVARALSLASTAKDVTDAVKAGAAWYQILHSGEPAEGYGTALGPKGEGNG